MRRTGRKEPEIARLHVFDEAFSVVIDCGDSRSASQHQCPFCRIVPMKFADAAGGQAHIDSRSIRGDWKVFHRHLPGPATRLYAPMLDGERIPERFDFAMIGWRRQEAIWAGLTQELVFWSWIACALPMLGFDNFLNILRSRLTRAESYGGQGRRGTGNKPATITCLRPVNCVQDEYIQ